MTDPASDPAAWIGRQQWHHDRIDANRARAMQATLDRAPSLLPGDPLPPAWHWLYFWEVQPMGVLGPDGHPARGGFLPPIALPRRMWAGGRIRFERPLAVGADARKTSTIADVTEKQGRSGRLAFVTVRHEIADADGPCLVEEQDIVYREAPGAAGAARPAEPAPAPAAQEADWSRAVACDPVLLFRYSALTFNGHRIHYDADYARQEEGHAGLVVHGPLLATLLLDLWTREAGRAVPAHFSYRAVSAGYVPETLTVAGTADGDGGRLWVAGDDGRLCMTGEVSAAARV